jgi:hypothetical protein
MRLGKHIFDEMDRMVESYSNNSETKQLMTLS